MSDHFRVPLKTRLDYTVFADPFTFRFFTFLLSLGTELTENQCQSVSEDCQIEIRQIRQVEHRKECQKICQLEDQKMCRKGRRKICRVECQKIEWQNSAYMPDNVPEDTQGIYARGRERERERERERMSEESHRNPEGTPDKMPERMPVYMGKAARRYTIAFGIECRNGCQKRCQGGLRMLRQLECQKVSK